MAADSPMRSAFKFLTFRLDQHDSCNLKAFSPFEQFRTARAECSSYVLFRVRLSGDSDNSVGMEIYRNPAYYELAFSFFDVKQQVDTFEQIARKFSKIRVKRFLDVACGPSLQLRELGKRGYDGVGLDSSPQMLRYLSGKAREEGLRIDTVRRRRPPETSSGNRSNRTVRTVLMSRRRTEACRRRWSWFA